MACWERKENGLGLSPWGGWGFGGERGCALSPSPLTCCRPPGKAAPGSANNPVSASPTPALWDEKSHKKSARASAALGGTPGGTLEPLLRAGAQAHSRRSPLRRTLSSSWQMEARCGEVSGQGPPASRNRSTSPAGGEEQHPWVLRLMGGAVGGANSPG